MATIINNVLLYGMNVQQAINEPAPCHQPLRHGLPRRVSIEQPRFDPDLVAQMEGIGYEMKDVGEYNMAVGGIAASIWTGTTASSMPAPTPDAAIRPWPIKTRHSAGPVRLPAG